MADTGDSRAHLEEVAHGPDAALAGLDEHVDALVVHEVVDGVGGERAAALPDPGGVLAADAYGERARRRGRGRGGMVETRPGGLEVVRRAAEQRHSSG